MSQDDDAIPTEVPEFPTDVFQPPSSPPEFFCQEGKSILGTKARELALDPHAARCGRAKRAIRPHAAALSEPAIGDA